MVRRLLCSISLCVLAACSGEEPVRNVSCEVVSSAEGQALSVSVDGTRVEVRDGTHLLMGDGKPDKRVYHEGNLAGPVVLEVKSADGGFKLRTASSALLWKVRFEGDDKIKVSDNEENARAWSIRREAGGEGKVRDTREQVVGRVVRGAVDDVRGAHVFAVRSGPQSLAYGALLMRGVPETERRVIVAELLARGK